MDKHRSDSCSAPWPLTAQLGGEEITVAAAADLNYALKDLAERFTKSTGTEVKLSFGASGNLFSQIQNGAPFDLFFSADSSYPQKLADAGQVDALVVAHLRCGTPRALGAEFAAARSAETQDGSAERSAGTAHCDCQSATRSVWPGRDGGAGAFRAEGQGRREAGFGREHQPGGAVRAVGQCAGRADRAVAGALAGDEGRGPLLGVAGGFVS